MKLSLLAKSCLCPGLVALITNLIKSSKSPAKEFLKEEFEEGKGGASGGAGSKGNWKWLHDYWQGKKYEIYRIQIPNAYSDQ